MVDWLSDSAATTHSDGAFLQWKPVCYTNIERSMASATEAKHYWLQNTTLNDIHKQRSVTLAYFGSVMYEGGSDLMATNVSFGMSKDKFYGNTNYTSW